MSEENREKSVYCRFSEQEWADIGKIAKAEGTSRSAIIRKAVNVLLSGGADKWAEAQARALSERATAVGEGPEAEALAAIEVLEKKDRPTFEAILSLARNASEWPEDAQLVRMLALRIVGPTEHDTDPERAGTARRPRRKKGAGAAGGRE